RLGRAAGRLCGAVRLQRRDRSGGYGCLRVAALPRGFRSAREVRGGVPGGFGAWHRRTVDLPAMGVWFVLSAITALYAAYSSHCVVSVAPPRFCELNRFAGSGELCSMVNVVSERRAVRFQPFPVNSRASSAARTSTGPGPAKRPCSGRKFTLVSFHVNSIHRPPSCPEKMARTF